MTELRCSNSCVRLKDGQELYCENTVQEIENALNSDGCVTLDLSDYNAELPVLKDFIVSYSSTD